MARRKKSRATSDKGAPETLSPTDPAFAQTPLPQPRVWARVLAWLLVSDKERSKALVPSSKSEKKASKPARSPADGRLAALRQAIAHTDPKDQDTKRALSIALAEAIAIALKDSIRADQREKLEFEQANALFHGQAYHRAGVCFEKLGRFELAARCYRQAGSIEALEALHERQDRAKQDAQTSEQFQQTLDKAFRSGRRTLVLTQCEAMIQDPALAGRYPELMTRLSARAREIQGKTPRMSEVNLRIYPKSSPQQAIHQRYLWDERIVSGRAPSTHLALPDQSLSREHLALAYHDGELNLEDLGSKTGTFLDGDALAPHEPTPLWPQTRYHIGLGMHASLELFVLDQDQGAVILDPQQPRTWTIHGQGKLALLIPSESASSSDVPWSTIASLTLHRDPDHKALHLSFPADKVALTLGTVSIDDPEPIQLLTQDQLQIAVQGQTWQLEVLA